MEKRRDVFQAISDPTRREIIHLIAARPLTVNGIAEKFSLTRPTISEHVKMLHDCGLLWVEKKGRERYCVAQLEKLGEVADWVSQYKAHWNSTLDSLEKYLDKKQASKQAKSKK